MGQKLFAFLIIGLFTYIALPLLVPVAMGAVFAVLFFPWLEWLERRKFSTGIASALLTVGVTLVFLLPATVLVFLGGKAVLVQIKIWKSAPKGVGGSVFENLINTPAIHDLLERVTTWFPVRVHELVNTAEDLARAVALKLTEVMGDFFTYLPGRTMALVLMVLSIYFFLVDGRRLVRFVRQNSFFDREHTEDVIRGFTGLCRSVILASLISGFVQAVVYTIGCAVVGAENVALIGFLVFLASFIPLIGATPLTFGVAINQLLIGNKGGGIALLILAVLVTIIDNLVRPIVLKGAVNLHPLLAFLAVFGGLQVLGVSGIFLGPIIAGLFIITVENLVAKRSGS